MVILASPNTLGHSPKPRLVVTMTRSALETADQVEQQLATGLGEGQIAQFVEHDEVHPRSIGHPALTAGSAFRLEPVDEVDDVEEAAAGTVTDEARATAMARCVLPVRSRRRTPRCAREPGTYRRRDRAPGSR